jgi:integrase
MSSDKGANLRKYQKNANGQGTIYWDDKRQRFVAQLIGLNLTSAGKPKRNTRVFKLKKDAQNWLEEQKLIRSSGQTTYSLSPKMTVTEFLTQWNRRFESKHSPETFRNYQGAIKRIDPHIGHLRASQRSPHAVEELVFQLEKNYGESTVRNAYAVLRAAYKYAVRMGDFPNNPVLKVDSPKVSLSPATHIPMNDFKKIYRQASLNPYTHARVEIGAMVGPRPGEILGLRWSDINWDGFITISRQLQRVQGEGLVFREVKQKKVRQVPVSQTTLNILKTHRDYQEMNKTSWEKDLNLVFPNTLGKPLDPKRDRKWWLDLLSAALVPHYTLYQMRKTAFTLMTSTGTPITTAMAFSGHSSPQILLNHYAFAPDETMVALLEKMDLLRPSTDSWHSN